MKDIIFPITYKYDDKGIKQAESGLSKLGSFAEKAGIAVAAGLAVAAAAATAFAIESVKAASDFQETANAVGEVFGESAKGLQDFAKTAGSALGQTRTQFLGAAKQFGIFGKAAGLADEQNAEFSKNLTVLATDLASFNNTSVDDAIQALGAALRGESEPIRRYGVLLDDATLKARAMEMGIYDGNGALTQQQRVLAANAEIFAQTSTQQGDYARTADGAANAAKTLEAAMGNLKITVGEALLPAVEAVIPAITGFIDGLQTNPEFNDFLQVMGDKFYAMVPDLITTVENLFKLLMEVLPGLNPLVDSLGYLLGIAAGAASQLNSNTGNLWSSLETLAAVLEIVNDLFDKFNGFIDDVKVNLDSGWWPIINGLLTVFKPLETMINVIVGGLQYIMGNQQGALNTLRRLGANVPNFSNADDRRRPMADGGIVLPRVGGVPVTVAEAGQAEAIIPLDRFDQVVGKRGGGNNIVINVNAGMGTDGAAVGEQIVNAIRRYERSSGPVFAKA